MVRRECLLQAKYDHLKNILHSEKRLRACMGDNSADP